MMDRVLCSRAREVGGCRHVPRGARRTDPQTMESRTHITREQLYQASYIYIYMEDTNLLKSNLDVPDACLNHT